MLIFLIDLIGTNIAKVKTGRISFLDVLSVVPPFPSHAWEAKPVERRDFSQSITICLWLVDYDNHVSEERIINTDPGFLLEVDDRQNSPSTS